MVTDGVYTEMNKKKSLSLKTWIDNIGTIEVSRLAKVTPATVRHWRRGYCLPRTEQMQLIKKYSRGAVTYDVMIDTFHNKTSRKKI